MQNQMTIHTANTAVNNILLGFWIFYNNNQENNTDLANELRKNNIDRLPLM
jgi:hypothetical protein